MMKAAGKACRRAFSPVARETLQGVSMKRALFIFVLMFTVLALAQEVSQVTVKSTEINSGVLIITAASQGKNLELQCNQGMSGCKVPQPGSYVMVRLPKNQGMYDCVNAEIFPNGTDPATGQRIGAYCVTEK